MTPEEVVRYGMRYGRHPARWWWDDEGRIVIEDDSCEYHYDMEDDAYGQDQDDTGTGEPDPV